MPVVLEVQVDEDLTAPRAAVASDRPASVVIDAVHLRAVAEAHAAPVRRLMPNLTFDKACC